MTENKKESKVLLTDVYKTIEKYLSIKDIDHNRIDVFLATLLSNKIPGTPIWMFFVGASGDWKSTIINAVEDLPNVMLKDQLTSHTFVSGRENQDLGFELQESSHILIFPDMASLLTMNRDEKGAIFGQMRQLYDGYLDKSTGGGVNSKYRNCHVTLIAGSTSVLRDEIMLHVQLGSRELMYSTNTKRSDNDNKMDAAIENEKNEAQMKKDISKVIADFFNSHEIVEVTLSDDLKSFLKEQANLLSILRAGTAVDNYTREPLNDIEPEVPTRTIKQFIRLAKCLKSIDPNYPDKKIKQIVKHIVSSSGHLTRQKLIVLFDKEPDVWHKLSDIVKQLKVSRNSIYQQTEVLWNLGIIEKDIRSENVGGYMCEDNILRGGKIQDVIYYKKISKEEKTNHIEKNLKITDYSLVTDEEIAEFNRKVNENKGVQ